jgi:hypothetical protein
MNLFERNECVNRRVYIITMLVQIMRQSMFGVLQGCGCHLTKTERRDWVSHVCGLCLTLRRDHGQLARLTTNYDAALLSVLYEAQAEEPLPRQGHTCLLRPGLHADVVVDDQPGARYAASICALIGATKIADHVADREGWPSYLPGTSARVADRWTRQARHTAGKLGFQTSAIEAQTRHQPDVERQDSQDFGFFSRPTELAVGAAFSHTAVLACRPANAGKLGQIGQMYGRMMYLLDSYRDYADDLAHRKFNALACCYPTDKVQGHAKYIFRQAHATLVEAFEGLTLARPALARKLLVLQLLQVGETTLTSAAMQNNTGQRRKPGDDGSWCDGCECCCHCGDCCDCHSCDCDCCGGCDGCDCGGCDCSCC